MAKLQWIDTPNPTSGVVFDKATGKVYARTWVLDSVTMEYSASSIPVDRHSVIIGQYIYVENFQTLDIYDIESQSLVASRTFPHYSESLSLVSSAVVGSKIYYFTAGGNISAPPDHARIFIFDTETRTFSPYIFIDTREFFPHNNLLVGDTLYVTAEDGLFLIIDTTTNTIEEELLPTLPAGAYVGLSYDNGRIFMFDYRGRILVYNISNHSSVFDDSIPGYGGRFWHMAGRIRNKIVVFPYDPSDTNFPEVIIVNPSDLSWRALDIPMPGGSILVSYANIGNSVYAFSGSDPLALKVSDLAGWIVGSVGGGVG